MPIEPYQTAHLPYLKSLINNHFGAVVPGWSLSSEYIERFLYRNPGQGMIDPWVIERKTLCVVERQRLIAAAHLLRYGTDENMSQDYKNAGDIAWLLAWPDRGDAAKDLLKACHDQMHDWGVREVMIWDSCLPFPAIAGIPHVWPHLLRLFNEGGYEVVPERAEAIYGGRLDAIPLPGEPPAMGITVERVFHNLGTAFVASVNGQHLGHCICIADLGRGDDRPALQMWAELSDMFVEEEWRSRGVGTWLVRHAVEWMRLAGCERIIFSVLPEDEKRGAGRFYQRFGWQPLTHIHTAWRLRGSDS